ncbi:MAG: MBL fold metallo-hydrolase [Faecousia sp.]
MAIPNKETKRLPKEEWGRQNHPIRNRTKMQRVYQKEPINATCWAYMKLLREHGGGRVYDVDPYVEVYRFRDNLFGLLMESADGMGDVWMYLIVGPEKALLIDTGFGIGNLKGLAEQLAPGKQIIVANTHNHFDHAYGNCQFDKVYCHEFEKPSMETQDAHIWDYLFEEDTVRGIWAEFDREDIVPFKPYEIVGCPDGYIINLGEDYEVELIHMGGHTPGHAGYLDKKNRIFFAGDDIVSMRIGVFGGRSGMPYAESASINTLCECLGAMTKRMDEFDWVFSSHFVTDLENAVIQSAYEALTAILEDPVGNAHCVSGEGENRRFTRYIDGLGCICYTLKAIR